jgi:hypothetical protein
MLTGAFQKTLGLFPYSISPLKKNSVLITPGKGDQRKQRDFGRQSRISNIKSTLFESPKEPPISQERPVLSQGSIRQF